MIIRVLVLLLLNVYYCQIGLLHVYCQCLRYLKTITREQWQLNKIAFQHHEGLFY